MVRYKRKFLVAKQCNVVFRLVAAATALLLFCLPAVTDAMPDGPIAATQAGSIRGQTHPDTGVMIFKGIHYGESTAGLRRFLPPVPVASWEGIQDALDFGPVCPQSDRLLAYMGDSTSQSEDCLVLNVWTPGLSGKRPVMFWIHGGGFSSGSGSQPTYDGTTLAKRGDVVVVTVNHRLNAFGYLYLEELEGGEAFAGSGMAGMLDLELALEWVRLNISAFGGDPENVTIFGESGGGFKVCHLMAMPSAEGLFHKAIIQSGPSLKAVSRADGTQQAKAFMKSVDLAEIRELQAVPPEKLVGKLGIGSGRFAPVLDGRYLRVNPFDPTAAPTGAAIPVIIGSNRDEALFFMQRNPKRNLLTEPELKERVKRYLGDKVDEVLTVYRKSRPGASPWDLLIAVSSEHFRLNSIRLAERRIAAGHAPVYMYLFDYEVNDLLKATHAMEIAFAFSNFRYSPDAGPEALQLETNISEAWIAFARTGNPNHPKLPRWPAYTTKNRETMIFDTRSRIVNDPRPEEWRIWEKLDLGRGR